MHMWKMERKAKEGSGLKKKEIDEQRVEEESKLSWRA